MAEYKFYASSGVGVLVDLIDRAAERGDEITVIADWSEAIGNPPDIAEQKADYAQGVVDVARDLQRAATDLGKDDDATEKHITYKIVTPDGFPIQKR